MLYQLSYSRPGTAGPAKGPRYGRAPAPARRAGKRACRVVEPPNLLLHKRLEWGGEDSNLCRLAPADLQSAPIGQLGHLPNTLSTLKLSEGRRAGKSPGPRRHGGPGKGGAGEGTRTPNHLITNEMLYQLSYASPVHADTKGPVARGAGALVLSLPG
jgi:hypothetical protein